DGEEPDRALRHGPGTGRRPGALRQGRADPGPAPLAGTVGAEVGAAAQGAGPGGCSAGAGGVALGRRLPVAGAAAESRRGASGRDEPGPGRAVAATGAF